MMSGDLKPSFPAMDIPPEGIRGGRKLGNGRQSPTSPLKLFGLAKTKINDIYVEISDYITQTDRFLKATESQEGIVKPDHTVQVENFTTKVVGIREMLSRDRMKVAFFGRTSNGKSTVINSMLKSKILPTGIGHTTNCFLQVEGTDKHDGYMLTEDSDVPKSIQSVKQLANALSNAKLDPGSLMRIFWPKHTCSLLRDDVVLVDSPGIDVSPDLDTWIDRFCLDADVFVLVANAESTLMQTEKNFFHKVSSRLSKPNIFILNNRWDASVSEPEMMDEVKKQHLERNIKFLAEELNVMERLEAEDRVFFVSAREALVSRVNQDQGTPTPTGQLLEGFQARLFEFCNFERKFEECISQAAVETKFAQHTVNGKMITGELRQVMDGISQTSIDRRTGCEQAHREAKDQLDYTEKQLTILTNEIKEKIKQMTEDVETKVSSALCDEIKRLAVLVDEFDRPFHPDSNLLQVYKKELHFHLEECLSRNLHSRCSGFAMEVIDATNCMIQERLAALLPEEAKQQAAALIPTHDFQVAYRLDCRNLCADFREDIQFRFSLGISSLVQRFLGPRGAKSVLMGYSDSGPHPLSMPQTPSSEEPEIPSQERELMLTMLGTFTSLYSRTTIGALAITGVVAKAAGWRVIAVCGAIYGLLYVYERLTWTNKAKERAFKRQYVDYATSKLKLIVDLTSANCSHQVQQELSSTFARLCRFVDNTKGDLEEELKQLQTEISKLDEVSAGARVLKNKANYLDTELDNFIHMYLKPGSRL